MKYVLLFSQVLCFFFLCCCSNQKQQKIITVLNHQTVDLNEKFIGYGGFLTFFRDTIVGIEYAPSMQPFFCFVQNGLTNTLFHFGHRGNGPNDFLRPYSIQYIDNQSFGTYDIMSKEYKEFSMPKDSGELKIDKRISIQTLLSRLIKTSFDQYIGLTVGEGMFLLMDSSGIAVNTFFEYPYRDNDERLLTTRSYAYQGTLASNPSKNKFVYASYKGEIIHFYEIKKNHICEIAKIENEYPLYKNSNDGSEGVISNKNGKLGYIATYATDNYVYAIFSGKTLEEHGIKVNYEGDVLRIFDWNGALVKEYLLDVPCAYLCVTDDDSKIWAIASNPDITLVSFDLDNSTEKHHVSESKKLTEENEMIIANSNSNDEISIKYQYIGEIPANKNVPTIKFFSQGEQISATTNSKDITFQDSVLSDNKSYLTIIFKKTKSGFFSDTVQIDMKTSQFLLVITGDAISER